jgi:hypothetical protein
MNGRSECERLHELGYQAGTAAGSWVLDGNSSEADAHTLLRLIEDGDPMFEIPSPLTGEWADGWSPALVLEQADVERPDDPEEETELLDCFEAGFGEGYEDEVVRSARSLLGLPTASQR